MFVFFLPYTLYIAVEMCCVCCPPFFLAVAKSSYVSKLEVASYYELMVSIILIVTT